MLVQVRVAALTFSQVAREIWAQSTVYVKKVITFLKRLNK
jgi:hypothetical protein